MSIEVVNIKDIGGRPVKPPKGVIYRRIDRRTPLGNPYPMRNESQAERDRVCDLYEEWLPEKLACLLYTSDAADEC
jgi:hypothetical protein